MDYIWGIIRALKGDTRSLDKVSMCAAKFPPHHDSILAELTCIRATLNLG